MGALEIGVVSRWTLKGFQSGSCWCESRFLLVLALVYGPDLFYFDFHWLE